MRAELTRAMRIVSSDSAAIEEAGGIEAMTAEARLSHVEIGLVGIIEAGQEERFELSEDVRMAFGNAVSVIKEIQGAFAGGKPIQAKHVAGVTKSLVDNVLSSRDAMLQMTALKNHTEYTYYHSANVAILSVSLASTISRDPRFLSSLGSGALLHDIGKLEVGLDIIEKPGRLDADEWEKMRQHPLLRSADGGADARRRQRGARADPRAPHGLGRKRLPVAHTAAQAASLEPHRRRRRQLRCDDLEAQLLGGTRPGPGDEADRGGVGHVPGSGAREAVPPHDGRLPAAVCRAAVRRECRDRGRALRAGRVPPHGAHTDRPVG